MTRVLRRDHQGNVERRNSLSVTTAADRYCQYLFASRMYSTVNRTELGRPRLGTTPMSYMIPGMPSRDGTPKNGYVAGIRTSSPYGRRSWAFRRTARSYARFCFTCGVR